MKAIKKGIKYLLVIVCLGLCYRFCWVFDPILAPIYDWVSQQGTAKGFSENRFQYISFSDLPMEEQRQYRTSKCKSLHYQNCQFIEIQSFDRYKNLIEDLKPYQLLTPDRLVKNRIKIPHLNRTQYLLVSPKLLSAYQALINHLKKKPNLNPKALRVTSGFRKPAYNTLVGGASCSQHQWGTAIDISVGDVNQDGSINQKDRTIVYDLLDKQIIAHKGGLGKYKNKPQLIHFDVRGHRARW